MTYLQLIKACKALKDKGYASTEEKQNIQASFKQLDTEEQEAAKSDVEAVDALPAEQEETLDQDAQKAVKEFITKALGDVSDEIKAEVKSWIESQEDLAKKAAGIYHPEVQEKRKQKSAYMRDFFRAVSTGDQEQLKKISGMTLKELTTDATGSPYGGYVVDSELSAEIRHLITEYGVARREMTAIQLSKNSYKANNLVTDVTVNWIDEAGAIGSTQVVLGQEELELKKLAAIVTLTRELIEDEEIDLFAFIAGRVAEAFAKKEDLAFFNGDGTSTYGSFTGALNVVGVNSVTMTGTTFASLSADDLLNMQDSTPQGAHANAKYYMHRTILSLVRKLKDEQEQYIYQRPSEGLPGTIWDKPYVLVEAMPSKIDTAADTPFILFGDLRKACILGYKGAIAADRFNAGIVRNVAGNGDINLITSDREAIRWVERVGYITILPSALTVLKTAEVSA